MSHTFASPVSGSNKFPAPLVPVNSVQGTCINCKSRPQARDPATGCYYRFCSTTCAGKRTNTSDGATNMCSHCNKRPKYNDGTSTHPFCGRTCARLANINGSSNANTPLTTPSKPTNPTVTTNTPPTFKARKSRSHFFPQLATLPTNTRNGAGSANTRNIGSTSTNLTGAVLCQIPGCTSAAYVDPDGVTSKYCTKSHRGLGERGCISCRKARTSGSIVFCPPCYNKVLNTAPMIIEVPQDHDRYKSVESQFRQKWLHTSACPQVRAVYKVVSTRANITKYERYLGQVESRGNFASQNKPRGNENRRWHGTSKACNIGDKGVTRLCSNSSCALCNILRTSFDISFFSRNTGFGRFGKGIYTSATSSKSNDYSRGGGSASGWKAMLLNKVVVGKGYKMTVDSTTLTAPPAGYDSVLAEVGGSLNYDELIVYNNDAIRPSYLVMYQ